MLECMCIAEPSNYSNLYEFLHEGVIYSIEHYWGSLVSLCQEKKAYRRTTCIWQDNALSVGFCTHATQVATMR